MAVIRAFFMAAAAAMLFSAGAALAQNLPPPDVTGLKTDGAMPRATMTGATTMNIVTAIVRQLKPCADRQVTPAPEAAQIVTIVRMRLNRDGSLASLEIVKHEGVTESNQRYVAVVDKAIETIFTECTPIKGLPPEYYDVPRGWRQITFRYRLRN